MGIYDRDYYRTPPSRGGFGQFVAMSVTTWLIAINVFVYFGDAVLLRFEPQPDQESQLDDGGMSPMRYGFVYGIPAPPEEGPLTRIGYFSVGKAVGGLQVWRFFTYQFVHAAPWHLLMNMLGLFFFGPIIEAHFGARRFLAFYLLCGVAGAGFFSLMEAGHVLRIGPGTELVGASGSIFGLLVATAMIAPDIQLFYFLIPVTIRTVAIIGMALAFYTVLQSGHSGAENAGGEACHLGGGVLGFLLIKNQHWLHVFERSRGSSTYRRAPARQKRQRMFQKDWSKDMNR